MTTSEFSSEFDLLYNNIMSNAAPGLNEYEKSVFLTQAQEDIIISIYNGTYNGDSFEDTEEVRRYISELVKGQTISPYTGDNPPSTISPKSTLFKINSDVWFITYQSAQIRSADECLNDKFLIVKPVTQDEFYSISRDPFRGANKRRVLRLDLSEDFVELVSDYEITKFYIRYISRPAPIILENLSNITIYGLGSKSDCQLSPIIHRAILNRAVDLARLSWGVTN